MDAMTRCLTDTDFAVSRQRHDPWESVARTDGTRADYPNAIAIGHPRVNGNALRRARPLTSTERDDTYRVARRNGHP